MFEASQRGVHAVCLCGGHACEGDGDHDQLIGFLLIEDSRPRLVDDHGLVGVAVVLDTT